MSDLEIIKKIEKELNVKLKKFDKLEWDSKGYTLDEKGNVTGLGLSECEITNLKRIIFSLKELKNLTTLYLYNNQISELAPLNELKNLTELFLSGNKIGDLAPLNELKNLTKLNLSHNQISELAPLNELKKLTTLDLSGNPISELALLKELKKLTTLHLSYNLISELTPLKELKNLTRLDLQKNPIEELPPWIVDFKMQIQWEKYGIPGSINFFDNPLKSPPPEIVKQGKEAVKNYFEQLAKQGKDYIYEAKLMLVGEPGSGKTTLMNLLFDRNFPVPKKAQKSTLGIEVRQNWEFNIKGKSHKAHIWDFGGQQIQYMLHQFFLTSDCLYILMAEKRKELDNFDYWLNIIKILGKNSPVVVLFNEIDIDFAASFIYDEKKYKELFPEMKINKLDVNLSDKADGRLNVVINTIKEQLHHLEHIGKEVPALWVDIRRELEEISAKKHISINEYFDICRKYKIDKELDQLLILKYFNILGIVLHFAEDPNLCDTLFLDPNWTVDAVYAVLTNKEFEKSNGVFDKQDIDNIWSEAGYNYEERAKLLQLMLKDNFDLCYNLPGNANKYIVPLLLPKIKPDYDWDSKVNLQFRFQYPFMPKGIVSRLIVRMNEYIDGDKVWNEGVVFSKKGDEAQVIEKETPKEGLKIIEIRLSGVPNSRKDFLTLIRDEIKKIQKSSFPDLPYSEMVPCNCEECKESDAPGFVDYQILEKSLAKRKSEIQCHKSFNMVDIDGLIDAVIDKETQRKTARKRMPMSEILEECKRNKVFISYSHKDKRWLNKLHTQIKARKNTGVEIDSWDDTMIQAGDKWREEIRKALASAKVAILLISPDFMASDFIVNNELPPLLKAAEDEGVTILSLILDHCPFEDKEALSQFQAFNVPSKPLSAIKPSDQQKILNGLTKKVAELMKGDD